MQVESIERKILKADQTIRHYVEKASNDPVAKQRALQAMKRKKMLEQQRQDLIGAQFNVDSLADHQEQAKFTLRAVEAMRAGRDALKKDQAKMDVRQVEDMLDQTEEMADEMRAISESLARGSDQASLESELMELQREYAPMSVPPVAGNTCAKFQQERDRAVALLERAKSPSPNNRLQWHNPVVAAADERARASAEAPLPPPPPPPPPPAQALKSPVKTVDQHQADLWAASALNAAMAPHGHLPYPGATPTRAPYRVAVAATFY